MSKNTDKTYTLTMTGLSFNEAKEIAENGSSLMWGQEDGKTVAYPSSNEHPAIITSEKEK